MPVSSTNALGIGDVLDAIYEHFPPIDETEQEAEIINVAIINTKRVFKNFITIFFILNSPFVLKISLLNLFFA